MADGLLALGPPGTVGALALAIGLAWAVGVLALAPNRRQGRRLAAMIAVDSAGIGISSGIAVLVPSYHDAYGLQAASMLLLVLATPLYLSFLATLDTPLARVLGGRAAWVAYLAFIAIGAWLVIARTDLFWGAYASTPAGGWIPLAVGPLGSFYKVCWSAVGILGLIAALWMYRRTTVPHERRKAKWYAIAFGVRDAGGLVYPLVLVTLPALDAMLWYPAILHLLFVACAAYAFLRVHVLGIDLRIKWTLRRGTLVGLFLAAFLIGFAIAEQYLQRYGVVVGGIAVGLLLFTVRPLERAIDRLADRAMPDVQDTDEYLAYKRIEAYQAALEGALEDGVVDVAGSATLQRLRRRLGISEATAAALARDAFARAAPTDETTAARAMPE